MIGVDLLYRNAQQLTDHDHAIPTPLVAAKDKTFKSLLMLHRMGSTEVLGEYFPDEELLFELDF